ncbi:MAG: Stp1/IreP family PP2C-type Ser/Thr phosphatase [Clostridiaceae bacterium]|nr:Stp1/IreP family PP2C-type Ser/Thr phosphatase [Clostridiaceae bacterium]
MRYSALSDIGLKRDKNEDNWNIILDKEGNPVGFIIADGMGGHLAGEEASRIAVEEISSMVLDCISQNPTLESIKQVITDRIRTINNKIMKYSNDHLGGMDSGTTLSVGVVSNNCLYIAHIGDSRVYRIRDDQITRLTQDHSYVAELVKDGIISSDEAVHHPSRNRLTRALGFKENFLPDFYTFPILPGDVYVFCTDGLYEDVDDEKILDVVNSEPKETVAKRLVELAKEHGGNDNITVIVAWM